MAPGATGQFTLTETGNLMYITANTYITINDFNDKTAYFEVLFVAGTDIIIKNVSDFTSYWMPYTPVALVGPRGYTGPEGTNLFTVSGNDISYTSGTTTLSHLKVSTTDYNRLPMGILGQTEITPSSSVQPLTGTTFPAYTNNAYSGTLIGTVAFTSIGPTGPRKVRTNIELNMEDNVSGSTNNNLYLTLYDDTTVLGRFRKTYRNGSYGDTINITHYSSITAGSTKTYKVYGVSDSGTMTISANTGAYDANNPAPSSYITLEDVGMG